MQSIGSLLSQTFVQSKSVLMKMIPWLLVAGILTIGSFLSSAAEVPGDITSTTINPIYALSTLALSLVVYYLYYAAFYLLEGTDKRKASFILYVLVVIGLSILISFASLFLIIPGIYVAIKLMLAQYYYLEGNTFRASLAKSWDVSKGKWWAIFGRMLIFALIAVGLYAIAVAIIALLGTLIAAPDIAAYIAGFILGIAMAKISVFGFVYFYLIYKDLKTLA